MQSQADDSRETVPFKAGASVHSYVTDDDRLGRVSEEDVG